MYDYMTNIKIDIEPPWMLTFKTNSLRSMRHCGNFNFNRVKL